MTTLATRVAAPEALALVRRLGQLTTVARCYTAGAAGGRPGGDFVEACRLSRGRVLISLGDVAGHGPDRAARMSQLRAAARRQVRVDGSPSAALRTLEQLDSGWEPEEIATLWLGVHDVRTGLLEYASAGHPPPVLLPVAGAAVMLLSDCAPPLGSGYRSPHRPPDRVLVPVGAVLVVYSDGLVERPDRDIGDQLELLRQEVELARDTTGSAAGLHRLVDQVVARMVPDVTNARDDVSIMVLRWE